MDALTLPLTAALPTALAALSAKGRGQVMSNFSEHPTEPYCKMLTPLKTSLRATGKVILSLRIYNGIALAPRGDDGQPLLRIRLVAKTAGKEGVVRDEATCACPLAVLLYVEYLTVAILTLITNYVDILARSAVLQVHGIVVRCLWASGGMVPSESGYKDFWKRGLAVFLTCRGGEGASEVAAPYRSLNDGPSACRAVRNCSEAPRGLRLAGTVWPGQHEAPDLEA